MNLIDNETETNKEVEFQSNLDEVEEKLEEPLEFKDTPDDLDFRCETINKILSPTHLVKIESELEPIESLTSLKDTDSFNK